MSGTKRTSPEEAHDKVQAGEALLVCAYESDEKFYEMALEGAISYGEFSQRRESLPRDMELIFYCG